MKKNIFWALVFGGHFWCLGQVPMFETTFYFEDAVGNKDTIIFGYDTLANDEFNPNFGETDDTSPFDSVFEVRAIHKSVDFSFPGPRSKKIISYTEHLPQNIWLCDVSGGAMVLVFSLKYPPLKMSWTKTEFDNACHIGGYITPVFDDVLPPLIWNEGAEFWCLAEVKSLEIDFTKLNSWFEKRWKIEMIEGGQLDTLWGLRVKAIPYGSVSPCWYLPLSTEEKNEKTSSVFLFPNPASQTLNVVLKEGFGNANIRVTSSSGAVVYKAEAYFEAEIPIAVPTENLPPGMYFLSISTEEEGLIATKRFAKL